MIEPVTAPILAYDGDVESAKALGAYYTDAQIADFLVRWAIRGRNDRIIDPSFGGGVFLRAACQRIAALGGDCAGQVRGVEIDAEVHRRVADKLNDEFDIGRSRLVREDAFDLDGSFLGAFDAVIGNPPFIRYQRFKGEARAKALRAASANGVVLSRLSSSWAPFVVQASAMLGRGGRLGFVVPMELGHAAYALPVLDFLRASFAEVTFLIFQKRLFPDLNEDTLLLLADGKGHGPGRFFMRDFAHAGMLRDQALDDQSRIMKRSSIDAAAMSRGERRLAEYLLPVSARALYSDLSVNSGIHRLGLIADIGIGYVTGNNDFFHLDPDRIARWRIPGDILRPSVRRGRSLSGLRFVDGDWHRGLDTGETGYLFHVGAGDPLAAGTAAYIRHGEERGVPLAYKCRVRSPWYAVPHVRAADAFLTYMSGATPKLVANHTSAVSPNSLHVVRLRHDGGLSRDALAVAWQTSLTRLSAEIEGHALGGGMLKLEPTEAERVLVATVGIDGEAGDILVELDRLTRAGRALTAQELADRILLIDGLGLCHDDCRRLRDAADFLRARRSRRGAAS